jgi:hypothetical protein
MNVGTASSKLPKLQEQPSPQQAPAPARPAERSQASVPPAPPPSQAAPWDGQSSFERAAPAQRLNLTGESAAPPEPAPAAESPYPMPEEAPGLKAASASEVSLKSTEVAGPGSSHAQSIESNGGVGVGFKFETATSPVVTKPGDGGPESKVKLQATGSVYAFVQDEQGLGPVTVEGKAIQGSRSTYELELTQAQYDQWVREGSDPSKLPNPYDPNNPPPPGATITLKSEDFQSQELQASYRFIQAQAGNTQARGTAQAVERLTPENPPRVRVSAGPTQAVQRTAGVGVGAGDVKVSLTSERGLESYNLQTATLDLSTDEGRAAYNRFILTGQVPQQSGDGVESTAREYKLSYTDAVKAGLVVGDHDFSVNLSNVEQEVKVTETDKERKVETGYFSIGDQGLSTVRSQGYYRDDSGQWAPHPNGTTQVALSNLSGQDAALLQEALTGQPGDQRAQGRYDAQLNLSDGQGQLLSQRARRFAQDRGLSNSPADVFIRQLSEARTPEEVQRAFNLARGNTAISEALWVLYQHSADPMPLGSGYQQNQR